MWTRWSVGRRPKEHRSCSVKEILWGLGIETSSVPLLGGPSCRTGLLRSGNALSEGVLVWGQPMGGRVPLLVEGRLSNRLPLSHAIGSLQPVSGVIEFPRIIGAIPFRVSQLLLLSNLIEILTARAGAHGAIPVRSNLLENTRRTLKEHSLEAEEGARDTSSFCFFLGPSNSIWAASSALVFASQRSILGGVGGLSTERYSS